MKPYIVIYDIKTYRFNGWHFDYEFKKRTSLIWSNSNSEVEIELKNALIHEDVYLRDYFPYTTENKHLVTIKIKKFE